MQAKPTKALTAHQTYTVQQAQAVLGVKNSKFYDLVNSGRTRDVQERQAVRDCRSNRPIPT
jgi:hypothetical protein